MKIATAAYPLDPLENWSAYTRKLEAWVVDAVGQGAELLVFPEYGAMELATLAGAEVAADGEASMRAVSDILPEGDALHAEIAATHGVTICAGSAPVYDDAISPRPVNRARLFTPGGGMGVQDKQIMTRYERDEMGVVPGGPLRVFDIGTARIGVLTCYDSEFPMLGRALTEADIILVPSCTEVLSGMAALGGACEACPHADANTGMGGIFGPPDKGFPETGVLAEGRLNQPGWTVAEVSLDAIAEVRANGRVLGRKHWVEQDGRDGLAPQHRI